MFKKSSLGLAAIACLLTACGGGGGGSSNNNPQNPQTSVALDGTNYTTASQEAVSSGFYVADTSTLLTGAQADISPSSVNFALAQLPRFNAWFANSQSQVLVGAVAEQTVACPNGGSMTLKVQDANNNNKADAGDSITITANQCKDGASTVNGSMGFQIKTLNGSFNAAPSKAEMTMSLNNLVVSSASGTSSGNGTINMTLELPDNAHINTTLSMPSFSVSSNFAGAAYSRTLENFTVTVAVSEGLLGAVSASTTISGTVTSSALAQKSITLSTPTAFKRTLPAAYPASGQLLISGANGSKARITAQSASQVLLEVDANGDGSFETSTTKAWSQLL